MCVCVYAHLPCVSGCNISILEWRRRIAHLPRLLLRCHPPATHLAALWNELNVRINMLRFEHINSHPYRRAIEILFLVLVYSTAIVLLPDMLPEDLKCQSSSAQVRVDVNM